MDEVGTQLATFAEWKVPVRDGTIHCHANQRFRGVLLRPVWNQVGAATADLTSNKIGTALLQSRLSYDRDGDSANGPRQTFTDNQLKQRKGYPSEIFAALGLDLSTPGTRDTLRHLRALIDSRCWVTFWQRN